MVCRNGSVRSAADKPVSSRRAVSRCGRKKPLYCYIPGPVENAIAKQLGVSTPSILNWIRAHAATPRRALGTRPERGCDGTGRGSRSFKKKNKLWIWLAFDGSGQRLIDWECGNRDAATLNRLLERLKPWSVTLYLSDYAPTTRSCRLGGIYRQG